MFGASWFHQLVERVRDGRDEDWHSRDVHRHRTEEAQDAERRVVAETGNEELKPSQRDNHEVELAPLAWHKMGWRSREVGRGGEGWGGGGMDWGDLRLMWAPRGICVVAYHDELP